jgi:acyl-CoA hydrolase
MRKYGYFERECRPHVRHAALFFGGASRAGGQGGWCDFIPNYFSEIPALIERGMMPSDVVFAMASKMSPHGFFALSLGTDYTMAAVAKARAVVLEVNPNVPFTHGQCHVHVSQVTALVESEDPILEVGLPKIGPVQEAIGQLVAEQIEDGSTLQIGYGGIPDAVVMQLTGKRDLGIHTEMIGDGILKLVESGAVNNSRKTLLPGKMVATFALGSRKLYEFMHQNPMLEMHPSNFTNDPYVAGQNDKLVTINASLQVDLLGQCGSESIGHLPYSGTGGQVDFVRAANRSSGGKSFIVLPSTAKDGTVSRIVPTLSPQLSAAPRHHQQERRQLRGNRMGHGPAARQVGPAARPGADCHRAPGLSPVAARGGRQNVRVLAALHARLRAQAGSLAGRAVDQQGALQFDRVGGVEGGQRAVVLAFIVLRAVWFRAAGVERARFLFVVQHGISPFGG